MQFTASVITGHGIGRQLGYPTLNFVVPDELSLEEGVFACRVQMDGTCELGVLFFGRRATFADAELSLEVHLLDWTGDAQVEQARIEIIEKIRDPQKFASRDALITTIAQDCEAARKVLARSPDNL